MIYEPTASDCQQPREFNCLGLVLGLAPEGGDEYVLDEILRQRRIPARQAAEEAMHLGGVRGDGMGHPIGWWARSVAHNHST